MAKYETMLVTKITDNEEADNALVEKFKNLIAEHGTIDAVLDGWGKRKLAYPIQKENEGMYTVIQFSSEPDFPAELERVYGITEGVLRSIVVALPED